MSRPYDAILFDFDGVLADSEPLHYECWKAVLADFHIDLDWETWQRDCIGLADREMMAVLAARCHPPADPDELYAGYPRKQALYRERVARQSPIPAEVRTLLHELDGMPMAVVSSSLRPEVEPLLEAAGVRHCFAAVVTGGDVERRKPAPDPYLLAARLTGAKRPLVVEDSGFGAASAAAAGFACIRVPDARQMPNLLRRALERPD